MKVFLVKMLCALLRIGVVAVALSLMDSNAQITMTAVVALVWGVTTIIECYFK